MFEMKKRKYFVFMSIISLAFVLTACGNRISESTILDSKEKILQETEKINKMGETEESDMVETISEESSFNDKLYNESQNREEVDNSDDDTKFQKASETIFETVDDTWIVGENGDIIASYKNGDFDYIMCYGEGYYILYKYNAGYDYSEIEFAVLYADGTWIKEYETFNYVSFNHSYIENTLKNENTRVWKSGFFNHYVKYCGKGVFVFVNSPGDISNLIFLSCKDDTEFIVEDAIVGSSIYSSLIPVTGEGFAGHNNDESIFFNESEYSYVECHENRYNGDTYVVAISTDGIVGTIDTYIDEIASYSDGGFIYYKETDRQGDLRFFDCSTGQSNSICSDGSRIIPSYVQNYRFVNGQAEINLRGDDGNVYTAIVDKMGNYVKEPYVK